MPQAQLPSRGFTVIEMLVVMTAMALLLAVVAPQYTKHVDRARETALKQDLRTMREAMDQYRADKGRYPASLTELVQDRYLRAVPTDPMTNRADTWVLAPAPNGEPGIQDVHSGSAQRSASGEAHAQW